MTPHDHHPKSHKSLAHQAAVRANLERERELALSGKLGAEAKAAYERIQAKAKAITVTRAIKPGIVLLGPRAPGRLCYRRHDPAIGKATVVRRMGVLDDVPGAGRAERR